MGCTNSTKGHRQFSSCSRPRREEVSNTNRTRTRRLKTRSQQPQEEEEEGGGVGSAGGGGAAVWQQHQSSPSEWGRCKRQGATVQTDVENKASSPGLRIEDMKSRTVSFEGFNESCDATLAATSTTEDTSAKSATEYGSAATEDHSNSIFFCSNRHDNQQAEEEEEHKENNPFLFDFIPTAADIADGRKHKQALEGLKGIRGVDISVAMKAGANPLAAGPSEVVSADAWTLTDDDDVLCKETVFSPPDSEDESAERVTPTFSISHPRPTSNSCYGRRHLQIFDDVCQHTFLGGGECVPNQCHTPLSYSVVASSANGERTYWRTSSSFGERSTVGLPCPEPENPNWWLDFVFQE